MDPNACLREMRELAAAVAASDFAHDGGFSAERMAELVLALDGWLKMGGFLPSDWARKGD